jgi:hypothetical protein
MTQADDPRRPIGEPPDAGAGEGMRAGAPDEGRDESITDKLKEGVEKIKEAVRPEDDKPGRPG